MKTHEDKVAELSAAAEELKSREEYQSTRTLSEMALDLCHVIEASPACEQHTKCSLLASQLREELQRYEDTRPLTAEENAKIADGWRRLSAVPINPNR